MKAEQIVHKMEKMVSLAKLAIKTEDAQEEAEATNLLEQLEAEMQTICAQLPDWVSVTEALPEAERGYHPVRPGRVRFRLSGNLRGRDDPARRKLLELERHRAIRPIQCGGRRLQNSGRMVGKPAFYSGRRIQQSG